MKQTKRKPTLIALALALSLTLALPLTACGIIDLDALFEEANDSEASSKDASTSRDATTASENGGDSDVGLGGLNPSSPPEQNSSQSGLPPGFESHSHDSEYFFAKGDDFLIARQTAIIGDEYVEEFGKKVEQYDICSFENGKAVLFLSKWVFEKDDYANNFAAMDEMYSAFGNVVYLNEKYVGFQFNDNNKEAIIESYGDGDDVTLYISKP